VDGQIRTLDGVERIMRQAVANNPANQSVIIRADKDVRFDHVVKVMDLCNQSGVADYVVTTQAEE
jgi:biopolymer transport protein ExbD